MPPRRSSSTKTCRCSNSAVKPGGCLILGPAESVGIYDELFKLVDRKNKIYSKLAGATPRTADLIPQRGLELAHLAGKSTTVGANFGSELLKMADRIMLNGYATA